MIRLSNDDYIKECEIVHHYKYDYKETLYTTAKSKVKIICPEHGIFEQGAYDHKNGSGCKKCSRNITDVEKKLKLELFRNNFIERSNVIHNNKYYYSLSNLEELKIKIICPVHGEFSQNLYNHLKGHGCSKCKNLYQYDTTEFIKRAIKIHGYTFDYSLVNYKNSTTKVKIICPIHGEFLQTPNNHLQSGCLRCSNTQKLSTNDFIETSEKKHNFKYDYSLVDYKNNHTDVIIICKKHGEFKQNPTYHKNGGNCPICVNESSGEKIISEILSSLNIKYERQKKFEKCRNHRMLSFDFYLPNYNLCVEYDGRQHFEPVLDFGGKMEHSKIVYRDNIKNEFCKNNNINLLRIKYNQDIHQSLKESLLYEK